MKTYLTAVGLAAGLLCNTAFASTEFGYSLTFTAAPPNDASYRVDPTTSYEFFGSFRGNANGDVITDLSDFLVSVKANGNLLFSNQSIVVSSYWGGPPTASLSGANNNFQYYQETSSTGYLFDLFSAGHTATGNAFGPSVDFHEYAIAPGVPGNESPYAQGIDRVTEPSTWTAYALSNVSPVPEPETYALIGLGLVGLVASRRRKPCAVHGQSTIPLLAR